MGSSGKRAGLEDQPPAEKASLASALLGCSTSQQCCCLPPLPSLHPSSLGIFFFLCGEVDGGRWSTEGKEGAPALEAEVLSLRWGTVPQLPPSTPSPARPGTTGSPEGLSSLRSSLVVSSGCPRSQQTLPSPAPPSLRTLAPLPDSPRVGAPACLPSSVGGQAPSRGWGGPQAP